MVTIDCVTCQEPFCDQVVTIDCVTRQWRFCDQVVTIDCVAQLVAALAGGRRSLGRQVRMTRFGNDSPLVAVATMNCGPKIGLRKGLFRIWLQVGNLYDKWRGDRDISLIKALSRWVYLVEKGGRIWTPSANLDSQDHEGSGNDNSPSS